MPLRDYSKDEAPCANWYCAGVVSVHKEVYMWFLILSGIVALLGGILILFVPKTLRELNTKITESINKMIVPIDEEVYKLRVGVGVSLLMVAGMIFYVIYYLIKKYG